MIVTRSLASISSESLQKGLQSPIKLMITLNQFPADVVRLRIPNDNLTAVLPPFQKFHKRSPIIGIKRIPHDDDFGCASHNRPGLLPYSLDVIAIHKPCPAS